MTIDMKQIGVVADATDNVLVPDFGQHRSGGRLHCRILPFFLLLWQVDAPPPAVLHGLLFRSSPERASDDQNISEALGQRLIWWARPHTGVGRRQIEAAHPIHPVDPLQALTRQFQEAVSRSPVPARVCPSPQRRAIHGVAAKIAIEADVLLKAPRHRCRPSEQTAEHHSAGLPPTMQQRPSKPLHGAGTATMTSVLFHRVYFALQFYRPNRVTLSHRDLTR
jgi:hypothetical protein